MKKPLFLCLMLILLAVALSSCFGGGGGTTAPGTTAPAGEFTVSVEAGQHFRIIGESSKTVALGGTVTFRIDPAEGYRVASVDAGTYDAATGTLTLAGVGANKVIHITMAEVVYHTVSVASGQHYTVTDANPKQVAEGDSATFTMTVEEGYYADPSVGEFNEETGILTVPAVNENLQVTFEEGLISEASYTVRILPGSNFKVTGNTSVTVKRGGTATFTVSASLSTKYRISKVSAGTYNEETKTLTVSNVKKDTDITVTVSSTAKLLFESFGAVCDLENGTYYQDTEVTVSADDRNGYFIGWSYKKSYADGGKIVSTDRTLHLTLTETVSVYANYVENRNYTLTVKDGNCDHGNGSYPVGTVITLTADAAKGTFLYWSLGSAGGTSLSDKESYTFPLFSDMTIYANYLVLTGKNIAYHMNGGSSSSGEVFYQEVDTSYYSCPNSLYDNGAFSRPGYVLIEYNTKADGSGVGYNLGSKIDLTGALTNLYCIWAKATAAELFTTEATSVTMPELGNSKGTRVKYDGLAITGYTGNDATLVIPEEIGGKKVIAIAPGAIRNKSFTSLVLSRNLLTVADGAFTGCSSLNTLYLSDSIYNITDQCFDGATYKNFHNFNINATVAPRYTTSYDGGYRVKWDRLMDAARGDMIVFVSGSSSLHGVSTEYLEALFDGKYNVVEYGTVRTTNNLIYMEAVANFVNEGDIVVYAPENSVYQFGYTGLTYKLYRDLEACSNVFRYVDIGNYTSIFDGFAQYQANRWKKAATSYSAHPGNFNYDGDYVSAKHAMWGRADFRGEFNITFNDQVKAANEVFDKNDPNWTSIATNKAFVKQVAGKVRANGASVYFGFCSVNANALTEGAKTTAQQKAFDKLITDTFGLEVLGSCSNHIYAGKYMFPGENGNDNSDFHLNDYGRSINTYRFYLEIAEKLGMTNTKGMKDCGTSFAGCLFE